MAAVDMTTTATSPAATSRPLDVRVMPNPTIRPDVDAAELPRISVVTACLNHGAYLEATLHSVLEQGYPNLEYRVLDGGSQDGSVELIKRHEEYLVDWVSEPDGGQYEAIQRGLRQSTGELMLWLNADDMLHRNALWTIARLFTDLPQVDWIMGWPTVYDPFGGVHVPPGRHCWSRYRYLRGDYGTIQQESVVWRRRLWEQAGGGLNLDYKLAADMELWMRFFRHAPLYTARILVGGFRRLPEQRSQTHRTAYQNEAREIVAREPRRPHETEALRRIDRCERVWLKLPVIGQSWRLRRAYHRLFNYPPVIAYNAREGRFELRAESRV